MGRSCPLHKWRRSSKLLGGYPGREPPCMVCHAQHRQQHPSRLAPCSLLCCKSRNFVGSGCLDVARVIVCCAVGERALPKGLEVSWSADFVADVSTTTHVAPKVTGGITCHGIYIVAICPCQPLSLTDAALIRKVCQQRHHKPLQLCCDRSTALQLASKAPCHAHIQHDCINAACQPPERSVQAIQASGSSTPRQRQ